MMEERSELRELIEAAVKAADAAKTKDVSLNSPAITRCVDILKRLKVLRLSAESIFSESGTISRLNSLDNHGNPKIRSDSRNLLDLWLRTLYASGTTQDSNKSGLTRPPQKKPNPLEVSENSISSALKNNNDGKRFEAEKEISKNKSKLLELFESAIKAADADKGGSPAAPRCIECLNQIKRMPLSHARHAINSTNIVDRLKSLTTHANPTIRSAGENLLHIWSKTQYSNGRTSDQSDKKTQSQTMDRKTGCIIGQKRKREMAKSFIKNAECCNPPCSPRSDESSRGRVREILRKALAKVAGETWDSDLRGRVLGCDLASVAASLESVMFTQWGAFRGPKYLKYKKIFSEIEDENNSELWRRLLLGEITPESVVAMRT